jgi:hypothetical protein
MKITFTKGQREDWIAIMRDDGSRAETRFPHKGPVPHDAVHLFVEAGLELTRGFWGMVADGLHPEELAEIAKAAGHASAKRASVPDASIVELLQAERLVEVFEADLWSSSESDEAALLDLGLTACSYSHVPLPIVSDGAVARIQEAIAAFAQSWTTAPVGQVAEFNWPMALD